MRGGRFLPHHRGLAIPPCITCVTHVPWCLPGSLTSGFRWNRCWRKRPRHSRWRMRNAHFYVSGKRSMVKTTRICKISSVTCQSVYLCKHASTIHVYSRYASITWTLPCVLLHRRIYEWCKHYLNELKWILTEFIMKTHWIELPIWKSTFRI